jgi:molybdopterin-guanine dinucleotide biosynthesis protein A
MIYGLLLAGGKSSRMGEDKKQLLHHGQSLLDHALDLLQGSGVNRVLISGEVEGRDFIPDIYPGSGPPGGIYSAVDFLASEKEFNDSLLLVIPVDMPFLTVESLKRLVGGIDSYAACRYENKIFPCVFRNSVSLYKHLQKIFADGQVKGEARSMRALLETAQAHTLKKDGLPENVFVNINTPSDLPMLEQ